LLACERCTSVTAATQNAQTTPAATTTEAALTTTTNLNQQTPTGISRRAFAIA